MVGILGLGNVVVHALVTALPIYGIDTIVAIMSFLYVRVWMDMHGRKMDRRLVSDATATRMTPHASRSRSGGVHRRRQRAHAHDGPRV